MVRAPWGAVRTGSVTILGQDSVAGRQGKDRATGLLPRRDSLDRHSEVGTQLHSPLIRWGIIVLMPLAGWALRIARSR